MRLCVEPVFLWISLAAIFAFIYYVNKNSSCSFLINILFLIFALKWSKLLYIGAFVMPQKYILYDFELFKTVLEKLNSKNIPLTHDLSRFYTLSRTIMKLLQKDETLTEQYTTWAKKQEYYRENTMMLAHDFLYFVGTKE